jgi:hypothetical protein
VFRYRAVASQRAQLCPASETSPRGALFTAARRPKNREPILLITSRSRLRQGGGRPFLRLWRRRFFATPGIQPSKPAPRSRRWLSDRGRGRRRHWANRGAGAARAGQCGRWRGSSFPSCFPAGTSVSPATAPVTAAGADDPGRGALPHRADEIWGRPYLILALFLFIPYRCRRRRTPQAS